MDAENGSKQRADVDRWLDEALKARVDEPRMGLEDRVLAKVSSEPQLKAFAWWWPPLAGAAAIIAIIFALVISHSSSHKPTMATSSQPPAREKVDPHNVQANAALRQRQAQARSQNRVRIASRTPDEGVRHSVRSASGNNVRQEPLPKLATFPAPRPETSEERLLARLAARRGSFEVASVATDPAPLRVMPVPEFTIRPLEEAPEDDTSPQ